MSHRDFTGAKIVLFIGDRLVAVLRDDLPTIPFPGQWDLPGGGREGAEGPENCALREVEEELGLRLEPDRIVHARTYPHHDGGGRTSWFLAAPVTAAEVAAIRLGDEGQDWAAMPIAEFVSRNDAVAHLRERVAEWWGTRSLVLRVPSP